MNNRVEYVDCEGIINLIIYRPRPVSYLAVSTSHRWFEILDSNHQMLAAKLWPVPSTFHLDSKATLTLDRYTLTKFNLY